MSDDLERLNPWFVRVRSPGRYQVAPYSKAGWIVTGIYVLVSLGLGLAPVVIQPGRTGWIVWGILFATCTIAFIFVALRNSVAAELDLKVKPRRSGGRKRNDA